MKYSITRQMLLMLVLCLVAPALFAQSSLIPGSGFGPIPDSPGMGPKNYGEPLDIVFNVQNKIGNVESVGVFFDAEHSFVGDLRVTLIAPDGRFHVLFEHTGATTPTMGGSDSDLLDTNRYVFGDASTDNWWDEAASGLTEVPSGNYRTVVSGGQGVTNPPPVTSMNDTFRTASPNGQWILRFEDGWDGDTGHVVASELVMTVSGQDVVVTTDADSGPGSLRDALENATSGDRIIFASPLFDDTQFIRLSSRLPDLADGITIEGNGAYKLVVTRNLVGDFRIFNIPSGNTVTLSGMWVHNGAEPNARGGGIANGGNLFMGGVMVSHNFAIDGGGVYNGNDASRLTMIDCAVFQNQSNFQGGGVYNHNNSIAWIYNSTFDNNLAGGFGGGIANMSFNNTSGELYLRDSTVANNDSAGGHGLHMATQGPNSFSLTHISSTLFSNVDNNLQTSSANGGGPVDVISDGFNLATDDGSGLLYQANDRINAVANIGTLDFYGGKVASINLLAGSEAIDGGRATGFLGSDTRGTGYARTVDVGLANAVGGDGSDIGAFEIQDVIFVSDFD